MYRLISTSVKYRQQQIKEPLFVFIERVFICQENRQLLADAVGEVPLVGFAECIRSKESYRPFSTNISNWLYRTGLSINLNYCLLESGSICRKVVYVYFPGFSFRWWMKTYRALETDFPKRRDKVRIKDVSKVRPWVICLRIICD